MKQPDKNTFHQGSGQYFSQVSKSLKDAALSLIPASIPVVYDRTSFQRKAERLSFPGSLFGTPAFLLLISDYKSTHRLLQMNALHNHLKSAAGTANSQAFSAQWVHQPFPLSSLVLTEKFNSGNTQAVCHRSIYKRFTIHDCSMKSPTFDQKGTCKPNGFTLAETLLSILILVILTGFSVSVPSRSSVPVFMQSLEKKIHQEQNDALANKEKRLIRIEEHHLKTNSTSWKFPGSIACEPIQFSFNAKGNINGPGSIYCSDSRIRMRLVLGLGAGSSHIEEAS